MKQISLVPFPSGAESNGFIAALASAVLPCLSITADTPYWCAPKGSHCIRCSGCDLLSKHQEMIYHTLLTASGLAFTFDYPEDDNVGYHTLPGTPIGWRWEEPFVAGLMDFTGLSYRRYRSQSAGDLRRVLQSAIDAGYPALCAKLGAWKDPMEWSRCWNIAFGYTDEGILIMRHGGKVIVETDCVYDDWIVITGHTERNMTYREMLENTLRILSDPSHDALENEIMDDLRHVTHENAVPTTFKMMGINGVPIEARWHAAEAFVSRENLLSSLSNDDELKSRLADLFFTRYIAADNNETHGIGWKIWGALKIGPETSYMPTEESFELIQRPNVQEELQRLFRIVFDNDRAVSVGIRALLNS